MDYRRVFRFMGLKSRQLSLKTECVVTSSDNRITMTSVACFDE